jgi:hypothetical protein
LLIALFAFALQTFASWCVVRKRLTLGHDYF